MTGCLVADALPDHSVGMAPSALALWGPGLTCSGEMNSPCAKVLLCRTLDGAARRPIRDGAPVADGLFSS